MAQGSSDVWATFQHDPRDPAVAGLRASDADRNVVQGVLTEAFADGRLDREEYDERASAALQARTLGELPPLVADLVPDRPLGSGRSDRRSGSLVPLAAALPGDIERRAQDRFLKERRDAFFGFLGPTVICWVIWSVVMFGAFPWPLFPTVVTFLNFLRVATNRHEIVASEVKRLERKRAKEIEGRTKKKPNDT